MWSLILLLGYMIVKTDHGYLPDGIYNELSLAHSHLHSDSPSIWKVKSDAKVLSSVINSHSTQTLYYASETTVRTLYPLSYLNNDSLGYLSNSIGRDSNREAFEPGRGNGLNEGTEKGFDRKVVKYVWVLIGLATLLIAAVALGFKLGRKSVKCKNKQSQMSTASSDEDARLSAPTTLRSAEEIFKVQSDDQAFNSHAEETSTNLSAFAVPRVNEEVKEFSIDCKHDRKASLVIETESISPIHFRPMKSITYYPTEPVTFEDFEKEQNYEDQSFSDSYESSESENSYDSSESEEVNQQELIVPYLERNEEHHEFSITPYQQNKETFQQQQQELKMPDEKKHEYPNEKFTIQDLIGYEKTTEIESEVRFERTNDPKTFTKVETHIIRTTYEDTQEVESYFDQIEKCNKPVLAVCGIKDHKAGIVSLQARPCSSPSFSAVKFKKQPLQLEFQELESFSEEEKEVDMIQFERSVSKSSESLVARESLDPDFKELFEVLDDGNYSKQFVVEKLLGRGAFGAVYLVRSK